MSKKGEKKRSLNFSKHEIKLLIQLVDEKHEILKCPKLDSATVDKRNTAWREITEKFNQNSLVTTHRDEEKLRKKYSNLRCEKNKLALFGKADPKPEDNIEDKNDIHDIPDCINDDNAVSEMATNQIELKKPTAEKQGKTKDYIKEQESDGGYEHIISCTETDHCHETNSSSDERLIPSDVNTEFIESVYKNYAHWRHEKHKHKLEFMKTEHNVNLRLMKMKHEIEMRRMELLQEEKRMQCELMDMQLSFKRKKLHAIANV